jgi:multiple sugar transport system permease protein
MSVQERKNMLLGLTFISPWILGLLAFILYPLASSAYYSFTDFSGFGAANWIGWDNYTRMFDDPIFAKSVYNTLYYTLLAVPIGVVMALVLALAMNQRLREVALYRAAFYLPSVLPIFALSFVFLFLMNPRYGLFNYVLGLFHVAPINWLGDPRWSKFSIVLLAQLGAGQYALIFLASIKAIPQTLYEAVELDGGNGWHKFWYITLPLITPIILYDVMIGLGSGLQILTPAYILTSGGPVDSTLFYVYYLYKNAFSFGDMGYASALSWLLFIVSVALAVLVFRTSNRWVNYEANG